MGTITNITTTTERLEGTPPCHLIAVIDDLDIDLHHPPMTRQVVGVRDKYYLLLRRKNNNYCTMKLTYHHHHLSHSSTIIMTNHKIREVWITTIIITMNQGVI
jgi:hypothetical protein